MSADTGHFADSLITRVRELGHPLCVGLDPHLARIPPLFVRGQMRPADPATADAVREFMLSVVDRVEGRVAVVKPQIALFEALGHRGLRVLGDVVEHAQGRGLSVLLDAKRGDIGSTAEAYARAYLQPDAPLGVEALTVNPYLGLDSLAPFLDSCRDFGRGLFVLVKTSNPGSADLQDQAIEGEPLYKRLAQQLAPACQGLVGPRTGWSSLGVVVGATYPEPALAVRQTLPKALFLVPGYGAQGGGALEAVRGFVPGPAGLEGGVVNSSRGILFPDPAWTDSARRWEQAIDDALTAAIDDLGEAVQR